MDTERSCNDTGWLDVVERTVVKSSAACSYDGIELVCSLLWAFFKCWLHFARVVDYAKCIFGNARLCVCLSVAACPRHCTDPDVT